MADATGRVLVGCGRMSMKLTAIVAIALGATAAHAQTAPRSTAKAAKAFSLDLAPTPAASDSPSSTPAVQADAATASPAVIATYTLDTPIGLLVADKGAKAVLDRDLPGLSDDPNLPKFAALSLRLFQPMTGGQLTNALLAKTGADLAALGGTPAVAPPLVVAPTRDRRMDSGR